MVTPTLHLSSLRFLIRHPWQFGLSVLSIALGVSVVVAVDLANESARRGFALSMESLNGRATHRIIGGPSGIPESFYTELRIQHGLRRSAPVVAGLLRLRGETFRLIGIDPFAESPFRELTNNLEAKDFSRLYTEPATVSLTGVSARRLNIRPGDAVDLQVEGRSVEASVVALIEKASAAAMDGVLIADIASAQEILNRGAILDRIDLILEPEEVVDLSAHLPVGLRLQTTEAHSSAMMQMSKAFHTNLSAMSLLAILVGGFLIYNTMTFSVLQRRKLLATKRMLGVSRGEIFALVLSESLVLGTIGALLGLLLGWVLGQGLVHLVTRTINDLYFVLRVTELHATPWVLGKGFAVGVITSLLAASGPALEAARTSPVGAQRRSLLEHRAHRAVPWLAAAGVMLAGVGLGLIQFTQQNLIIGFVALFVVIMGYSLIVPLAVLGLTRVLEPMARKLFGTLGGLSARGINAGLSRTGLAISALTIAVSATVGVGAMIDSFRATVATWLDQTLQSDIYVSAPGASASRADGILDPVLVKRLRGLPGTAGLSTGRRIEVSTKDHPLDLLALDPGPHSPRGFRLIADRQEEVSVWPRFADGEVILISEPLAYHRQLTSGDRLTLFTDRAGYQAFVVGGIFHDYGSSRGMVVVARRLYDRFWNDPHISTIGLQLGEGVPAARILAKVKEIVGDLDQAILVRSNRAIREESLAIFDRTFTITQVLRLLTVGVAFIGILSALMALQLEKSRDLAVLRATGVTPRELFLLVLSQTGIMGLMAGLLALPVGWLLSELLIHVINLRAFGWSMQSLISAGAFIDAVLLGLGAALLAGLYPAYRMSRTSPAAALREE